MKATGSSDSPLDLFAPPVRAWFRATMGEPTRAQALGWPPISRGESTLLLAPTGSGKTLAAFLVAIDRLVRLPPRPAPRPRVLYVSPLKALAVDVERNLRLPVRGIVERAAAGDGAPLHGPTVDVRTGDTPAAERARMRRSPADILITTPESLYLLLTSASAHAGLATVDTIIVDEIHALVASKRGAHLALSLERLEALRPRGSRALQRIGLSATQRPIEEAARLLGGFEGDAARPVTIVDAGARRELSVRVVGIAPGPLQNPTDTARAGGPERPVPLAAAPARVLELVLAHRSTIVFVNSRRLAERLATAMNDAYARTGASGELALAHHGSIASEKRAAIEERLKGGDLRAIVATSSLELGIDMGAVDQVVQVEAPPSVASGLQRIGRACHNVGGVPNGVLLPRHKQDLLACAAAAAGMREGEVEETRMPHNPLDVLAQQIVAMVALEALSYADLFARVRRAAPFSDLPRGAFDGVLDMLSGRYPSDDFAELRPRVTWDRARGRLEARPGALRLAVTSGGTIPDRGLVGVFTEAGADGSGDARARGRRVGELDEEMVFELRVGEVFLLGASSWKAEAISHDRVVVSPAGGRPGKMPFWHGDRPGRARSFGERIGRLARDIATDPRVAGELAQTHGLEAPAAAELVAHVREQVEATTVVPSDRTIVVERFVDEVGDWRVVVLCPLGTRVIAPWAIATAARLRRIYVDVDVHYTDDGMALRIPACDEPPPAELFVPPSATIEADVTGALDGTALFAARFRECAARALLLPRRDPKRRTPLWAQRKRAADLLAVASRHPTFPIVLEVYRECLRDLFDMPGLVRLLGDVEARDVRVAVADRRHPSPFAANVLFGFIANFIYEGDAPVAERRAQAMTIDHERLRELLGDAEARQVLDPDVVAEHERWLQWLSRPATHADAVHDLLLYVGDLTPDELAARCSPAEKARAWSKELVRAGRVASLRVAGEARFVAIEDVARMRDALGAAPPAGLSADLLEPAVDPTRAIVSRFARTRGPFPPEALAKRFGVGARLKPAVTAMLSEGRIVRGAFLPGGQGEELCDRESLDAIRRKSLAKLRRAVEPVGPAAFARFLLHWQGVPKARRGRGALLAVVGELAGCPLLASALESAILPARLEGYRAWDIDSLCASGEVVWAGVEKLGATDGRIALYRADQTEALGRPGEPVVGPIAATIRSVLRRRGAVFFADLAREAGGYPGELLDTLWAMVWAGEVTNDTMEPLRSRSREASEARRRAARRARGRPALGGPLGVRAPGSEGRWSLLSAGREPASDETARRMALAQALLERNGIVMRETAHAEGVAGGFAAVYDVLKMLEERGRVRRGYFVHGRGGAQFALPGAEERLRLMRDPPVDGHDAARTVVLAATDPANPWGAVLDWPPTARAARSAMAEPSGRVDRPQRAAGALAVLEDGEPVAWLGRPGELILFAPRGGTSRLDGARVAARALASLVPDGAGRALTIATVDGEPAATSDVRAAFIEAGFSPATHGLFKRPSLGGRTAEAGQPRPA